MSSVLSSRQAHITYDTNESTARNKNTVHVLPNSRKFRDKLLIVVDVS